MTRRMRVINAFVSGACATLVLVHLAEGDAGRAVLAALLAVFNLWIALLHD